MVVIKTKGVHHIVLNVKNLEKSKEFYSKVCGMKIFAEKNDVVGMSNDYLDSLWLQAVETDEKKFDEYRIGLDHWAFTVETMKDLQEIETHLKKLGIEMEDGGITDDDFGGTAIFTKDPDGMKVEFHLVSE